MKRVLAAAAAFGLLYGLAGCDDNGGATAATPRAAASSDQTWSAADVAAAKALAVGPMQNLVIHDAPKGFRDAPIKEARGDETTLAAFDGQVTLLNLWATWCAPCREEMPSLANLQKTLGSDDFGVAILNLDRGGRVKAEAFLKEIGVDNLPLYLDPKNGLARQMAALGLPVTAILGRDGREIARLTGPAHWDSPEAVAMLRHLIEATRD